MPAAPSPALDCPPVTVVVPVRGAGAALAQCVSAVLAQGYPAPAEIIVVDNNARPGTAAAALGPLASHAAVRILHEPVRGLPTARNSGILAASHDVIACLDADCLPEPGWLIALVRACDEDTDMVGGAVAGLHHGSTIDRGLDRLYDQRAAIESYRPHSVIGCNMLARRDTFLAWGLFDERFLRGQDVELVYRVHQHAPPRLAYAPDGLVRHVHDRGLGALVRKGYQHGLAAAGVLHVYDTALTGARARRLRDWRAWTGLGRAVAATLVAWAPARRGPALDRLCDAIVRASKHVGMMRGTIAWARRPARRSRLADGRDDDASATTTEPSALVCRARLAMAAGDQALRSLRLPPVVLASVRRQLASGGRVPGHHDGGRTEAS